MTAQHRELVRNSWDKVLPIKDDAAELFYGRRFEVCPEVRPYIKGDLKEPKKADVDAEHGSEWLRENQRVDGTSTNTRSET